MGFLQKVNKLWSGADFWDKKENQQQRQSFAQQDEEERRRRAEAAARGSISQTPAPTPGDVITPQKSITATGLTLGGDLRDAQPTNPLGVFDPTQRLQKAQPQQPAVPPVSQVTPVPNAAELRQKAIDYNTPKVQDVNGYYGSDLKLLQEELAKGEATDYHRVQGLMQSLDNRRKELADFHKARGENVSFKTARELEDTVKQTRGDWTGHNQKLKDFWDNVGKNEAGDFEQYIAERNNKIGGPMSASGVWKNGNGMNFTPDFSKDIESVKAVKTRQEIADAAMNFAGIGLDQMGGTTISGELDKFNNATPEQQRATLKTLEQVMNENQGNFSANPDLQRKSDQAFLLYTVLTDKGTPKENFHTRFNKFTDAASNIGSALIESPKHVIQSADVVLNQQLLGKGDRGEMLTKQHNEGKLSDEEYNKAMADYVRSLEWVPDEKSGLKGRALVALGTTADTIATFYPVGSLLKGAKAGWVTEQLVKEGLSKGLTREAATTAAKEITAEAAKEGAEQSLKHIAAREAVINAALSGTGSLRTGEFNPAQTAKETLLGGAIGGVAPVVGAGGAKAIQRLRGAETVAPGAVEDIGRATSRLEGGAVDDLARATNLTAEEAGRVQELQSIISDTSTPSFQKTPARQELQRIQETAAARSADPLDRPTFLHKQDIQDVVDEGQQKLDDFLNENPNASLGDLETARLAINKEVLDRIVALQDARYGGTAALDIPDVASPRTLAKAEGALVPAETAPIADFSKSLQAPLRKAEPTVASAIDTQIAPAATDAAGNPALVSDTARARQLAQEGVVPTQGQSPVALTEDQRAAAAARSARESVSTETPAPLTRERLISQTDDPLLKNELIDLAPPKERVNLTEADNAAKATVNDMTDEQLLATYSNPQAFQSPEDLFRGLAASRRLQTLGTDEARQAVRSIVDAMSEQSSKSGLWQRASQILFEDMPTEMKADYLMKKLSAAGSEMTDADRQMLVTLLTNSDGAAERLRTLQDEARSLLDSGLINKGMTDATRERIGQLSKEIQAAARIKELEAGKAWEFYRGHMPKTAVGKRFGDVGRTMMLSAPSGRAFDLLSTSVTTADDLLTRGVSNLIGKGVNLAKAPGAVSDTIISPRNLVKGLREGARNFVSSLRNKNRVEDFMTEAQRATRGDIQGGSGFRRTVRALTNLPTELTRGLREEQLFRQGMQEAAKQGLKGEARRAYATLRAAVPSQEQLHEAIEIHMKANMLHNNRVSRFLNGIAQSLDSRGSGWAAAPIRNQIMPFTSWIGGFIHRTLTDKNVLYNATKIMTSAGKRDLQGVVDNVSKLAVNGGEAYAAGILLTRAGILTNEDANGDKYGGVYFHIGDRYIPVAIAGTVSIPIILGNALEQATKAHENGESPMATFTNAVIANTIKNAGVQSVFGGTNTLQSTIASLADDRGNPTDAIAQYVGDFTRQYIPAIASDTNALLDYYGGLNKTHEAALTKAVKENPETGRDKTDILQTEINKTLAKVPVVAQGLPRDEGRPARDILDRSTHGTHETVKMAQEKQTKLTDQQEKKKREKDEIPDTKEAIAARVEQGDFGAAIAGYQQQLKDLDKKGKDASPSEKQDMKDDIKRLQITMDGHYGADVVKLYKETSLSDWRNMIDPDDEDYDPETAGLLLEYDKKLADAGVSLGKKSDKTKYSEKKSGGSGSRGGRGGAPKLLTDIGMISGATSVEPFKPQSASNSVPKSAIPILEKVPNYDSSKLKKISVKKGRQ